MKLEYILTESPCKKCNYYDKCEIGKDCKTWKAWFKENWASVTKAIKER